MTSTAIAPVPAPAPPADRPDLDLVVPVFNEVVDLAPSVHRLVDFCATSFPFRTRITIADNASTDGTDRLADALAAELPGVRAVHLTERGRGRALRAAWSNTDAQVVAYMDVDLSTDLAALLPLVAPLLSGHSDVAIGTRLARSARVVRGPKREVVSRSYNLILRAALGAGFSDAQCGFKAMRADCARTLLPLVRDDGWFFDTELLVLAERAGLRIHEVPVDWVDDADSRVDLVATAVADLSGVARLGRDLALGRLDLAAARALRPQHSAAPPGLAAQVVRFAAIGVASTVAYLLLFLVARPALGAQGANALALLLTAVGNTAANRRWTFAARSSGSVWRHQVQGLAVFVGALAMTAGSLALLHRTAPHAGRLTEVTVLVLANIIATGCRFAALRGWVFRVRSAA